MRGARDELGSVDMRMLVGLMRVDADRRPHIGFALGGRQHLVPLALAGGDIEHRGDPARAGAFEHRLLILRQALVIQMTMTVGQHHSASTGSSSRGNTGVGAAMRKPLAA